MPVLAAPNVWFASLAVRRMLFAMLWGASLGLGVAATPAIAEDAAKPRLAPHSMAKSVRRTASDANQTFGAARTGMGLSPGFGAYRRPAWLNNRRAASSVETPSGRPCNWR